MPSVEFIKLLGLSDTVAEVYSDNTLAVSGVDDQGNQSLLKASDAGYFNAVTLTANDEVTLDLHALGGRRVEGHFVSSGTFTIVVRYQDNQGNTIREENAVKNRSPNDYKDIRAKAKSDYVQIAVQDESGSDQTVSGTAHYI